MFCSTVQVLNDDERAVQNLEKKGLLAGSRSRMELGAGRGWCWVLDDVTPFSEGAAKRGAECWMMGTPFSEGQLNIGCHRVQDGGTPLAGYVIAVVLKRGSLSWQASV